MSFLNTLDISASALTAERMRMDIIAQNLANIDNTRSAEGGPYRRQLTVFEERPLTFQTALDKAAQKYSYANGRPVRGANPAVGGGVRVQEIIQDESDFVPVYNPAHPDADENGYVLMPNVDRAEENVDLMAATHSYNANITTVNVIKAMAMKAAEILK